MGAAEGGGGRLRPSRPRPGWVRRTWARHPRVALAVRAGLAAALSWVIAQLAPAPAGEYPYYAPLGAVIATTFSLAGSLRESVQAVGAIALGGSLAFVADLLGAGSSPVAVAVVVGAGVVLAGWRPLGEMGSWVTTAALFTLIVGRGEAFFIGVYAGLVLLGAAVGLAVIAVFPVLPLAPVQQATAEVRRLLVRQLRDLADALDAEEPPDEEEWRRRHHDVTPARRRMRDATTTVLQARRGNVRARRYASVLERERRQSEALDQWSFLVADLADLLRTEEIAGRHQLALGVVLRPAAAEVLRRLATVLDGVRDGQADPADHAAAEAAFRDFIERVDRSRTPDPGGGTLVAGTMATTMRRCLDAVPPREG